MSIPLEPSRTITLVIAPALDQFIRGEVAQGRSASERDYIVSVLSRERERRLDEQLRERQIANTLSHLGARDLV